VFQESVIESGERRIVSISCGKERLGLSSFAQNHSAAALLFTNLLENAAAVIPQQYHEYTSLYVRGTAGMRLLGSAEQETLWDATVLQLKNTARFPFKIDRKNFGTISGHQEAFYAVLASNYIAGSIDGDRR
jgi:Golgi nucleoside diphosphatase